MPKGKKPSESIDLIHGSLLKEWKDSPSWKFMDAEERHALSLELCIKAIGKYLDEQAEAEVLDAQRG